MLESTASKSVTVKKDERANFIMTSKKLPISKFIDADGSTIVFIKKEIDMEIEHVIFNELKATPKIAKEKFKFDCKFERYVNNWCSSKWKLKLLRDLNRKLQNAKQEEG